MTSLMEQTLLPSTDGEGGGPDFESLLSVLKAPGGLTLQAGDRAAEVPETIRQILETAIANLVAGTAVTISPHRTQLTTQEAADLLGISRPTLVRLIENDDIPYTRPGRHRRIQLADVLAYRRRIRNQRARALEELAEAEDVDSDVGGFITTR